MRIIYSDQQPIVSSTNSIFLCGPTPRSHDVASWRPEAISILQRLSYQGVVFIPEPSSGRKFNSYEFQVEWEYQHLSIATKICVWLPRQLDTMPGFTTNIEFGYWIASSPDRVIFGRPDSAVRIDYLDWMYTKLTGRVPHSDLETTLKHCLDV
jgi:hypothetical protein